MIIIARTLVIFGGIALILAFLPQLLLPPTFVIGISNLISSAYKFNHIVDIDTLIIVFNLFLASELVLLIWKVFKSVLFLIK